MRTLLALLVLLGSVARSMAQDELAVLDPKSTPRKMLHSFLLTEAQKAFEARRDVISKLKTPADIRARQEELRAKFIEALGGFPEKTPLNANVVGTLNREGYRVEKVVYESRPNHHVTGNLYLPEGKGPFPGVLLPMGHSGNGKVSAQTTGILLARHGFVALAYDPISQGERRQSLDEMRKPLIPSMTNEHTLIGVGALLTGHTTATYRIWDGIRSLDYLTSRPEVDPKRIGCTGCSGGGTLTSYLMALDERIVAAAPSCYITSLERLFATIGPQDGEQNIPSQVRFGMEHADYLLLHAPRPTLICASTRDFFDIQGTWTSFREAKRLYTLLGHAERIDLVETDTTHGFPVGQREAMLRFMMRWLQGKDTPATEQKATLDKEADLLCTRTGQVLEDLKGKSVFQLNQERAEQLTGKRSLSAKEVPAAVRSALRLPDTIGVATSQNVGKINRDGYEILKDLYTTEPGIQVPVLYFRKNAKARDPLVVYLHERGKSTDAGKGGPIEQLVKAGNRVLAIDVRGVGETAPAVLSTTPGLFGVDYRESFISMHLDRPLLGQKVHDVLSVIMAHDPKSEIHLVGVGNGGLIALHVATVLPQTTHLTLEGTLLSWEAVVRTPASINQLSNVVPSVLTKYDLPTLVAAMVPKTVTIRNPVDATGKPVSQKKWEETYAPAKAAFEKQKAGDRLKLIVTE